MVLVNKKEKRTPTTHKRRRGEHHKKSTRNYRKAYWPYLPMALIVGVGIIANIFWGTIQHHVLSYATNMSIDGLLQETNKHRLSANLGSLALNAKLNQAAQAKAEDMAARDYWSHDTPEGNPPWTFISQTGYSFTSAGENLAYGFDNSTEAISGWMASPGHKANMMSKGYTQVGFGIANSANFQETGPQTVVVAMYANPQVLAAAPEQPAEPPRGTPSSQEHPAPGPAPTSVENQTASQTATEAAEQEPESAPAPIASANGGEPNQPGEPAGVAGASATPQKVARIQLMSGAAAPWSVFAISAIATVAIIVVILRHGLALRKLIAKSEKFILKHPLLDIALVAIATAGIILTRTHGIIQ